MSDIIAVPADNENVSDSRSLGREVAHEATVNFAAAAATSAGFIGGLMIMNRIADRIRARRADKMADTVVPQESETETS